ncbi:MAG TPA: DegT/DnrJ/EryC1/StrS family aminotransferase [Pyrinomonadaceae bacterium]|nr:DegT/DnrJ/EryC1/StrS family aminotransferase [Pyrinomonadaceae bacterium]
MKIPLVDLKAQYASIKPDIDAAIERVVNNTSFILGKEVAEFEQKFAEYVNAKGAVGVASGTAALHLSLLACGVGPGDEVITTAHTFIATAEPISQIGAKPVFVDIDPDTYNIDANLVEKAITPRTKAIIPVHLYGQPSRLDVLLEIARRHRLWLIEDAAQAHGAEYDGHHCGSVGDLACFSFYPGKNLGAYGDAGAVTGNNEELLTRVRKLRDHGRTSKYEHDEIGFGERLDSLQAAILGAKLPHLEEWTEARRSHAKLYNELLRDCDVITPYELESARHVYHLYVIRTPHRDQVLAHLKSKGVDAGIHYPVPLHRQPAFLKQGYSDVRLPVTEQVASEVLSLPLYPELTYEQILYVTETVKEAVR